MFINASPDSHSLDMVDLRHVFNFLSVLNISWPYRQRAQNADQGVDVRKELSIEFCVCLNCFVIVLSLQFWDWNFINIIDVRALWPEKCLDLNSLCIISNFFTVPTFLVQIIHRSFAIRTLLQKPPTRTTPMDHILISRAFLHTRASCYTGIPTLLMSLKTQVKLKQIPQWRSRNLL